MFRENPHVVLFVRFSSLLDQFPFLIPFLLSGLWDFGLDLLGWEENSNPGFPRTFVFHRFGLFTLSALSLSNTYFDLIILRTLGSLCCVLCEPGRYLYILTFLTTLPRNSLKWSLWDSVDRMGTKSLL